MGKPRAKRSKPQPIACPTEDQNDPNYGSLDKEDNSKDLYDDVDAFIRNSFSPWMMIHDMSPAEEKKLDKDKSQTLCRNNKHVRPYFRYKQALVKFSNDTGFTGLKILSIFNHGLINHECTISQWKKKLEDNDFGNKWDRFNTLERLLYEAYVECRKNNITLNENDLIYLARQKHEQLVGDNSPAEFEASRSWFHQFILRHRLTSRKITRNQTRRQKDKEDQRPGVLKRFIMTTRENIEEYGADNVWNADESGVKYETVAKRTFEDIGRKQVFGFKEQEQLTRYSHTIFPVISAGGKLMPQMLIVLRQEPYKKPLTPEEKAKPGRKKRKLAEFGPKIVRTMFRCPNLYIRGQSRGYTTMTIINDWFTKVYLPSASTRSCLMLDAAATRKAEKLLEAVEDYKKIDPNKHVKLEKIPPRETGTLQPCDKYLFLAWKHFHKEIQNQWRKNREHFRAFTRNNVLKIQAFIHNQFSAKKWSPAINKSWADCCYVRRTPERYQQMTYYCFQLPRRGKQMTCEFKGLCKRKFFIKCFRCETNLCFTHWLFLDPNKYDITIHYHDKDDKVNEERPGSDAKISRNYNEDDPDDSDEIDDEDEEDRERQEDNSEVEEEDGEEIDEEDEESDSEDD